MIRRSASLASRLSRFRNETDGVGTVTSLLMVVVMVLVMGLGVDYSMAIRTQARLQAVADAAALSAAMRLPDPENAQTEALFVSALNGNNRGEGALVRAEDIEVGSWYSELREFHAGGERPNAVRVVSRRSGVSENPLPTLLVRFAGVDRFNLTAQAIAVRDNKVRCSGGGFFSARRTSINNTNHFFNGFCLHGEEGVTLRNSSYFEPGTTISMPNLADFTADNNNIGAEEALREFSHTFVYLGVIEPAIEALRAGDGTQAGLPDFIGPGPVFLNRINSNTVLHPHTLYVVNGSVDLGAGRTINDIAIVAAGDIRVGSNTVMDRMIMATDGSISFNSNNRIGRHSLDFCATGVYSTHLLARGDISFNSNNEIRDVLMASLGAIDLGHNNRATDGVLAEALGPITVGNADRAAYCRDGLEVDVGAIESAGAGGSNLVH